MADYSNSVQSYTIATVRADSVSNDAVFYGPATRFTPALAATTPTGAGQMPDVVISFTVSLDPES